MKLEEFPIAEAVKPIAAYLNDPENAALAIITNVEGPSYRPIGAMMALFGDRPWVGTLSSGCVESDINFHAHEAIKSGAPSLVKYGRGSPYIDIQLPCGGGLEILVLPNPDVDVLKQLNSTLAKRIPCTLKLNVESGEIAFQEDGETKRDGDALIVHYEPDPLFLVFGKGPEASTFAALAQAAGYPNLLLSPDEETLSNGVSAGCKTHHLTKPNFPQNLPTDHRTAIVLFFHDHDWEPDILIGALQTDAFYIGAQGSKAASEARLFQIRSRISSQSQLDRIAGPIGLIPSVRDAKTLAVSVLAEVLQKSRM